MKIYHFNTRNFSLIFDTEPDFNADLDFDETGETRQKVESGEWECFAVRCSLYFRGGLISRDYLAGCIYENPEEFRDNVGMNRKGYGSYFSDMARNVISEGREKFKSMPTLRK
jgi:hypothetical protein